MHALHEGLERFQGVEKFEHAEHVEKHALKAMEEHEKMVLGKHHRHSLF